ncbi:Galactose oxidase, central domain [Niastella yeongjuensis]|nr:Galactose oxidase, central domain [Niastella yeongjuensis]
MACNKSDSSSDDLTGNWSVAADFKGDSRSEAATFVINDIAYVLTGTSKNGVYNDMYAFDVTNSNWTKKAAMPASAARNSAVAFTINGKGYVGTGYQGDIKSDKNLKDFWEYDPATETWTEMDTLPGEARFDAASFVINGKAYVCGGFDNNKAFNDCFEFDPSQPKGFQWKEKASFSHKTYAGLAFTLNNKGYLVTGTNNSEVQKELYEYDADQNLWTTKRPLYNFSNDPYDDHYTSIVRQNGVAFTLDKYAFIALGSNSGYVGSTWAYDADADTWKEYTGFEAKTRDGAVAFTVKNRAFVLTGITGTLYLDNMFEFNPFAAKVDND